MKVGDLIKWSWHLGADWAMTHFTGIIVDIETYKMANAIEIHVFQVLDNTGVLIKVREDDATLQLIDVAS